jgi:tripartite-type tricarboxylate transporter receptor subunit TctC
MNFGRIFRFTLALWLLAGSSAMAQGLRGRTTVLIVPLSVGTGIDSLARFMAERLTARLGGPVVVDNRTGASGLIGSEAVAGAAPDGFTLLVTPGTILSDAAIHRRPDPTAKFVPVVNLTTGVNGMIVGPNSKARSVKDIVEMAKAAPGKLMYSAAGTGSVHTLAMELFKSETGTDILRVPFKGANDAMSYVMTGQVDMMIQPVAASAPFVGDGKLRMLAIPSDKRSKLFPDVPTMTEAGYPIVYDSYYFVLAPAGTPPDVVARLNKEFDAVLKDPAFASILDKLGLDPAGGSPEDLAVLLKNETARLRHLVETTNMTGE